MFIFLLLWFFEEVKMFENLNVIIINFYVINVYVYFKIIFIVKISVCYMYK